MDSNLSSLWASLIKAAEESSQTLTGAGVGLVVGTVIGVLLSEWLKHRLRSDEIRLKSSLDQQTELLKKELSSDIEVLRNALSKDLEDVKDAIKLSSAYSLGVTNELSKAGGSALSEILQSHYDCENLLALLISSRDEASELYLATKIRFLRDHTKLMSTLGASKILLPEKVYLCFNSWSLSLSNAYKELDNKDSPLSHGEAVAIIKSFNIWRHSIEEELRSAVQKPS